MQAAQREPEPFELVLRLDAEYPGDPGVAVALLLNRVVLRAGECLWLPAGNIHAYLRGLGIELMGPSDNVLRGGLTPKHVDVPELLQVLDFTGGPVPYLHPTHPSARIAEYSPASLASGADVPFVLRVITGDAALRLDGPAIAIGTDGGCGAAARLIASAGRSARRGARGLSGRRSVLVCPLLDAPRAA